MYDNLSSVMNEGSLNASESRGSHKGISPRLRLRLGHIFIAVALIAAPATDHYAFIIAGAILVIYGELVRIASAGQIRKNTELATSGPYAYTRNPLYFGSMMIGLGVVTFTGHWLFLIIFLAILPAVYHLTILGEEEFLKRKFGEDYARFVSSTPRLIPHIMGWWPPGWFAGFDASQFKRNREIQTAFVMAVIALLFIVKWALEWQIPIWK